MNFDKRLTPARADLAAEHLKGKVDAPRYVIGRRHSVRFGRASLRARPSPDAPQDSELLFGETFTVYDVKDGWAWGQLNDDDYVGYVRADSLGPLVENNARVTALMTPLLSAPDVKSPSLDLLPMNAALNITARENGFAAVAGRGFVATIHLDRATRDWVAVAERFIGVPYVWGGKTQAGMDCSGLIQTARHAAALSCPRDTDMQRAALGENVSGDLRRGDLVFWKGHVGVMLDGARLLHANAHHNEVAIEPLSEAQKRIEANAGLAIASIKRISN